MRPRGNSQAGFTMVELMVTMAVSVIGVAGVLALQLATIKTNAGAAQSAEAVGIAGRTIEEARGLSLAALLAELDDDGALPIDHDFDGATVIGRTTTYRRRIVVEALDDRANLLRVRVEVTWTDDRAAPHLAALELLRTRQEAL